MPSRYCVVIDCPNWRQKPKNGETLFAFPSDERILRKWFELLELRVFRIYKSSLVCSLHFEDKDMVRRGSVKQLRPNTLPLEFKENGRKLLNSNPTEDSVNSTKDLEKTTEKETKTEDDCNDGDLIGDFEKFRAGIAASDEEQPNWRKYWNIFEEADLFCFYRLSRDVSSNNVTMSFKILVDSQMRVTIFKNEIQADSEELDSVIKSSTLEYWAQFIRLMDHYLTEPDIKKTSKPGFYVERAIRLLDEVSLIQDFTGIVQSAKALLTSLLDESVVIDDDEDDESVVIEDDEIVVIEDDEDVEYIAVEVASDESDAEIEGFDNVDHINRIEEVFVKEEPHFEAAESIDAVQPSKTAKPIDESWQARFKLREKAKTHSKPQPSKMPESPEPRIEVEVTPLQHFLQMFAKPPKQKIPKKVEEIPKDGFQCEFCARRFQSGRRLYSHVYHSHKDPSICDKCGKRTRSKSALQHHMTRHDPTYRVKCPHCDDVLLSESLRRHIKVQHEGYKPFACSVCGKMFSDTYLRRQHERIHVREHAAVSAGQDQLYSCPKCHHKFERGGKFIAEHIAKCNGSYIAMTKYRCLDCDQKFITKVSCVEHYALKHNFIIENVEKFCFDCRVEVINPKTHRINFHGPLQCDLCGTHASSKAQLETHMARHQLNENRPFACSFCGLFFRTSNHLSSHKMSVHTSDEEKAFPCHICNRRFPFQYMLNNHILSAHFDPKIYACPLCDLKFRKLKLLTTHCQIVHNETDLKSFRIYSCIDCVEKYTTFKDLKLHRQNTHKLSYQIEQSNKPPIDQRIKISSDPVSDRKSQ